MNTMNNIEGKKQEEKCMEGVSWIGRSIYLIPLFGFGSTRSGKGTDAGEESAKLAAWYPLVKETEENIYSFFQHKKFYQKNKPYQYQ